MEVRTGNMTEQLLADKFKVMEQVYFVAYNNINGASILSYERHRCTVATVKQNNIIWTFTQKIYSAITIKIYLKKMSLSYGCNNHPPSPFWTLQALGNINNFKYYHLLDCRKLIYFAELESEAEVKADVFKFG